MDNRKEETAGTVESSRLIIENYNGPEGIANLLKTNNEVSFILQQIDYNVHICLTRWERSIHTAHL